MRSLVLPFEGYGDGGGATNTLLFYLCDEASDTDNLIDYSGSGYTLTQHNDPRAVDSIYSIAPSGARDFDGASQYFDRTGDADARAVLTGNYTFECLIKPLDPTVTSTIYEYAGSFESSETADNNILLRVDMTADPDCFITVMWEHGSGTDVSNTTTVGLTNDVVNYLAIVVDDDSQNAGKKTVTIWGGVQPHTSTTPLVKLGTFDNLTPANTSGTPVQSHFLGATQSKTLSTIDQYLQGRLELVRVSRYPLQDTAIMDSYRRCFQTWIEYEPGIGSTTQWRADLSSQFRVMIEDGDGVMQDMTDFWNHNFVRNASINHDIDSPMMTASVSLVRDIYHAKIGPFVQLSPLNWNAAGSYDQLLQLRRRIQIDGAIVPAEHSFGGYEWSRLFDGYIDEVDWSDNAVEIRARDIMVPLFDTFILESVPYSAGFPKDLQDHIQEIIDDNEDATYGYKGGTPTLYVEDDPSWSLNERVQESQTVGGAIQDLADNIAYDVKAKWDANRNQFRITQYVAPRSSTTAVWTVQTSDVRRFSKLRLEASRIRNDITVDYFPHGYTRTISSIDTGGTASAVRVTTSANHSLLAGARFKVTGTTGYNQSNATDGAYTVASVLSVTQVECTETVVSGSPSTETSGSITGGTDIPVRCSIRVQDTTSITAYGVMAGRLTEGTSSMIDTAPEAKDLADGVLSDLAQPLADVEIEIDFAPHLELHDIVTVEADDLRSDQDVDYAVTGIKHQLAPESRRTMLTLRGSAPAGKSWGWQDRMSGYPNGADALATSINASVATPTLSNAVGGVNVDVATPLGGRLGWNWDRYDIHVGSTSGFFPSSTTLVGSTRGRQTTVTGITPGAAQYLKVVAVDKFGNNSTPSTAADFTPTYTALVPSFRAYLASAQTLNASDTIDRMLFDTEIYDFTSAHTIDGTTYSYFTAPVTGLYQFGVTARVLYTVASVPNNDEQPKIYLYKNTTSDSDGTKIAEFFSNPFSNGTGDFTVSGVQTLSLTAADTVCVKHIGLQLKGYDAEAQTGSDHTFWWGHLVVHTP